MTERLEYLKDGGEIYRRSFATIRSETDLSAIPDDLNAVAVRMVHACGMVDVVDDLDFSPDVGRAARSALRAGAPVLVDAMMVLYGVTRSRLPAENRVLCMLGDPAVPDLARRHGTTRSAAALDLWLPHLDGAVVAIGNAPTALFRLLEMLRDGAPRPGRHFGNSRGLCGCGRIEARPGAGGTGGPLADRARATRGQRPGGRGGQRAGQ